MADTPNYGFNPKPRFSVNHLAEYLCTTNAKQRINVIREAKFPRKPQTIPYTQIKSDLCRFLAGNTGDVSVLEGTLEKMKARELRAETPYARLEARRCQDAVAAFIETFKAARGKKYTFVAGPQTVLMKLEGVAINVRMDVGLIEESKDGQTHGGGCVLFLAGSDDARKDIEARRKHAAAIIHWGLEGGQLEPLPRLCLSFDAFGRKLEKAPTSFDRLRANMRESCGEVADRWDGVKPPPGYDGPDWE